MLVEFKNTSKIHKAIFAGSVMCALLAMPSTVEYLKKPGDV